MLHSHNAVRHEKCLCITACYHPVTIRNHPVTLARVGGQIVVLPLKSTALLNRI